MSAPGVVEQILDLARWAPSGDNTQPWRFELAGELGAVVHGFDTRSHCVYDLDGHASQISLGALLETASIAATAHGLRMQSQRRTPGDETRPTFDLAFTPDPALRPDPLVPSILTRSVQRRPLRTRRLAATEKRSLEAAVGARYTIVWLEGSARKLAAARLMFDNAKLRLTMPEAYEVHKRIIEWDASYSEDRVPERALGVDRMTAKLMRFVMQSWERVVFFNEFLAGTFAPRVQMDFVPSLMCGAHFAIAAHAKPGGIDDYVAAGRAIQRFWLTATSLGLQMQPELTPLIFGAYVRAGIRFTRLPRVAQLAAQLEPQIAALVGDKCEHAVWMGRIGAGPSPVFRSTRRPLSQLMTGGRQ